MSGILKIILIVLGIILVVAVLAALYFLVLQPSSDETVPTLVPTAEPVEIPSQPPEPGEPPEPDTEDSDAAVIDEVDVWSRIQESGTMLVGISADYPPFEFYTNDFQLDGFDIALIEEVGQLMEVEIEFSDISFGGLFDALAVYQVDLAISAISHTPEREDLVDFSDIYFVSEDAVLVTSESSVGQLNDVENLAAYRIGVQSGTVYENWLRAELVDTGLMPETNLFIYQNMDLAISQLASGLTDMVVLDLPPAEVATSSGEFRIAASGLNRQLFAVALPQGAGELQAAVNEALQELWDSGRMEELAEEYLSLTAEDIIPVPTPDPAQPTSTPGAPTGCADAMQYVADLSYDDQNMTNPPTLLPGEPFRKGWRVRNTGNCAWNSLYSLVPVGGNNPAAIMGGEPVVVQGLVQPGQEYDFWADLVAPLASGVYQEFWSMNNSRSNKLFGSRVWVGIQVAALPTVTPLPTQTPSAGIAFTANPTTIDQGQCSTLSWQTENVKAVYVYPQGEDWQNYGVAGTGTRQVCPTTTTTYELRVVKLDDSIEIRQVTVTVNPVANAPVIQRFTVEPTQIALGQCVNAQWQVTGEVNNVSLFRDEQVILGNAPLSGSLQDCPPAVGEFQYLLEATGPGGVSRVQQYVRVIEDATPVPTPGGEPIIKLFNAMPDQIKVGECTQITWSAGGGTSKVDILKDGQVVLANAPFAGSQQDCLNSAATVIYSINATSNAGQVATQEAAVTVSDDS
jgi:polar amino acid transport system substrate-binding protein